MSHYKAIRNLLKRSQETWTSLDFPGPGQGASSGQGQMPSETGQGVKDHL